jgi:hypothetical protein
MHTPELLVEVGDNSCRKNKAHEGRTHAGLFF